MATIYQRGIQKRKSLKARQCNGHKIPKGIQKRKSLKTRQCNGHKIPKGYSEA